MATVSELKTALALDIQKLSGESRGFNMTDFPVTDSKEFLAFSMEGVKLCHRVVHDSVPGNSAALHEEQSCVCPLGYLSTSLPSSSTHVSR